MTRELATKPQTGLACGLAFSRLIGFFLTTQSHSRNISGVHCFPGLTVKSFPAAGHVATAFRTMIILRTL